MLLKKQQTVAASIFVYMSVLNIFQYKQCLYKHFQNVIVCRPDLHNLQTRRKKFKRVANGCKSNFCHCKNQKNLQISLLPSFPIMSEKYIIYRSLKHRKNLKTLTSPLRS